MKRELILDEVKYDGEYFTTKILKQTHRGEDFTPDGEKYEGGWKYGKFHGEGTLTSSSGEKYVGNFKDGKRQVEQLKAMKVEKGK